MAATHAMCLALQKENIPYDTRAILTSSAASFFFLTGSKREVLSLGTISFHGVGFLVMPGEVNEVGTMDLFMRESWKDLIVWAESLLLTTNLEKLIIKQILNSRKNHTFNAAQAVREGIAHEEVVR